PVEPRWYGQWHHLDAFFQQRLGVFARRLAADTALIGLAVVDAARLLGKALADVFGVRQHVAHRLHPHRLQLRRADHLLLRRLLGAGQVEPRRTRQALHRRVATQRALHLAALALRLVIAL